MTSSGWMTNYVYPKLRTVIWWLYFIGLVLVAFTAVVTFFQVTFVFLSSIA